MPELDPNNYLAVYGKAAALLALGKLHLALSDVERVIQLRPGYIPGHKQKSRILLKLGDLKGARAPLYFLKTSYPETEASLKEIDDIEVKIDHAKELYQNGNFAEAIPVLDTIMQSVSANSELQEMRANCYLKTGEIKKGIQDLRKSVHLINDNRAGILSVAVLMYNAGFALQSLEEIRSCLQLDQGDEECRQHYSKVKKLAGIITGAEEDSNAGRWTECLSKARTLLSSEKNNTEYVLQASMHICHCGAEISQETNGEEILKACDLVIRRVPQSVDFHLDKATVLINQDRFDEAIQEYQKVLEMESQNRKAREGLDRVQRLKKQATKRDYYKILGVSRTASTKEINKAYRKLASVAHPDNYQDPEEKKEAEKRFINIAAAKEVLSDPEKRAKFDQGIDPLDTENQGGGGGHPFFHGGPFGFTFQNFNPFEGGNFEFHFG
ncbi:DnaJ sub C member 3 [Sparganum proliferum]